MILYLMYIKIIEMLVGVKLIFEKSSILTILLEDLKYFLLILLIYWINY